MATSTSSPPIPASILIVGSGVFGLSTAYALATDPDFKDTEITVVDRQEFPAADASSIDTSRIIRADYADPAYAALAFEAQSHWRGTWGLDGRYTETGLCVVAEPGSDAYVRSSLSNVRSLLAQYGDPRTDKSLPPVEELNSQDAIRKVMGKGPVSGSTGYLNRMSGWADAEASMRYLGALVRATQRVTFVQGTVDNLLFTPSPSPSASAPSSVAGVRLSTSTTTLTADLTILACGAWTSALLDTRGIARATGQIVAYVPLSQHETSTLHSCPTLLNLDNGMFIIPPSSAHSTLKVARHGHGYVNPSRIPHPEAAARPGHRQETITTSLPRTHLTSPPQLGLPREANHALRSFLQSSLALLSVPSTSPSSPTPQDPFSPSFPSSPSSTPAPPPIAARAFSQTRLCWYTDTPTGDFIIDYHPAYASSLFVATGGSGHAFKFLPVIGEKIVLCVKGRRGDVAAAGVGGVFDGKWRWRGERVEEEGFEGDGSRGGERGMVLGVEMGREGRGWRL
ncbi:FAD dependent oxidoreductase [Pseudovirgaria hyperparasitica]|uniref:FAD dependent oxidoreductase n=1 Tax=Pseudovirgaria hyperparasitica TaxID=470096 RepID=A0A6A6WDQ8_9PEZI|nr:FAD dependent oxidoreductase [Pseudovirgaria hyperparasitica]KAF2760962.1 FAD dependent oxidoreductase [Pseudovirgaria hyperparasitica]